MQWHGDEILVKERRQHEHGDAGVEFGDSALEQRLVQVARGPAVDGDVPAGPETEHCVTVPVGEKNKHRVTVPAGK